ncbi:hypothetical protein BH09SUM1_BH09SUM1_17710 [soil metagenome]
MNQHSSKRCLAALISQMVIPSALAVSLFAWPVSGHASEPTSATAESAAAISSKDGAALEGRASTGDKAKDAQIDALLKAADDDRRAEKFEEGLRKVESALAIDQSNSKALKLRGKIEDEMKQARDKAVEDAVQTHIKAAKQAIKEGNFESARRHETEARSAARGGFKDDLDDLSKRIETAEGASTSDKNSAQIKQLLDKADEQLKAKKYDDARESLNKVFQLDKKNKAATKMLEQVGEKERANMGATPENPQKSVAAKPAAPMASSKAVDKMMADGKYDDAANAYRAALEADPSDAAAQKGLREAEARRGQAKGAEASKLIAQARTNLRNGKREEATALLQQAKEIAPDSGVVRAFEREMGSSAAATPTPLPEMPRTNTIEIVPTTAEPTPAPKTISASAAISPSTATPSPEPTPVPIASGGAVTRTRTRIGGMATPAPTMAMQNNSSSRSVSEGERQAAINEREAAAATPTATPTATPRPTPTRTPRPTAAPVTRTTSTPAAAVQSSRNNASTASTMTAKTPAPTPAKASVDKMAAQKAGEQKKAKAADDRGRAKAAYEEGIELYKQKQLARARQRWVDAKNLDSSYLEPDAYLQNTEEEFNKLLASDATEKSFEAREAAAQDKMNTLIPLRTLEPTSVSEFLNNLRLLSGIDFVITGEVKAKIEAAFEDEPLHKVLDKVLLPMGLRWDREPGSDTVVITPDLRTEVFTVLPEQLNTVDALIKEGVIARLLYGPSGEAVLQGQEISTDPRQSIVIMTDSETNLEKFRRFLEGLKGTTGAQLIIRTYEIDEKKAPRIKALIEAILQVDNKAAYNQERKLLLEGSTLIIKDTPENIQKVETILQDQNFLKNIYSDKLEVATFNLTPVTEFEDNPDLIRAFADQVVQVVQTLLYAREGRAKSERDGRRIWYDPGTLQLTITDYPDNLSAVTDYIESLPEIRKHNNSKIIFLDWATASELVPKIEEFLGITNSATGGGATSASGTTITKTARVEDVINFNGASFRVTRVNENDVADKNDDSVELVTNTGTTSQDVTLEEFRSEFVEDFQITAEDIDPSNTPGEGRARLTIRYVPGGQGGLATNNDQANNAANQNVNANDQRDALRDQTGLSLVDIENLNALLVNYTNIEDLRKVQDWVQTLDIPTLQVSIEVKFVEVVTNKAKEWKPEFNFSDLTEGVQLSDDVLRSRFANDRDEYGSPFDPTHEQTGSANLLKGTSVFNYIVANGNSPISFTLRVLEAQGVINVVNGPTVTVLNNETADFEVERIFGIPQPLAGSTGGTGTGGNSNLTAVASIQPVELSVTPTVTRAGNITLDIDVEMRDFDQNLGQIDALGARAAGGIGTTLPGQVGVANRNEYGVLRKQLTTKARIKDGGTVVLGGWRNERTQDLESGIPILQDIPFIGKYLFNRTQRDDDKITLLIFLTGQVVKD